MPAVRWLHWDEAYRRRERLTVTVTRYCNARNAPPLYQFRFAASGRSRPERRSRRIPRETAHAPERKWKEIIIPSYANMRAAPNMHLRGVAHYAVSTAIFSRCLPHAEHRSFAPAKWSERALWRIPAGRRERQGKISFNLLRFLPSPRPDLYGNYPSSVAAGKWTGQLMQASRLHNILIKYFFGLYNNIL